MVVVDTSVWIDVLRDASGGRRRALEIAVGDEEIWLSRLTQLELLQGARDEREWSLLAEYLEVQDYLELTPSAWGRAARLCFDLRRQGLTVRAPLDCCIAQVVLEAGALLLHRDRDFVTIAGVRPLRQLWLRWPGEQEARPGL